MSLRILILPGVALRKESVDRNKKMFDEIMQGNPSLSARRAWIEILHCRGSLPHRLSLSARRAWIEMLGPRPHRAGNRSLSARRAWIEIVLNA